jgi:hypothetical protein
VRRSCNGSVGSCSSDLQLETVKLTRRVSLYWVTVLLLLLSPSNAKRVDDRCKCVYRRICGCEEGKEVDIKM